jgi:nucleoside-diphosphate-sugar epimerase
VKHKEVILVTGAAGFVGFHVAKTLATEWKARVVALDTFCAYYDVQLKKDRSTELVKAGVDVYRGDVCDQPLVTFLFQKYNFTGVIHLAAQAGVRHSMKDPLHYLNNNVRCFVRLLEILKTRKVTVWVMEGKNRDGMIGQKYQMSNERLSCQDNIRTDSGVRPKPNGSNSL